MVEVATREHLSSGTRIEADHFYIRPRPPAYSYHPSRSASNPSFTRGDTACFSTSILRRLHKRPPLLMQRGRVEIFHRFFIALGGQIWEDSQGGY